jgi:CspA family cold shock protein
MPTGHVKWFNNAKGYGFIVVDGSDRDYFAHFSSIKMEGFRTLKAGQPIVFEAHETPKGAHAINIEPQRFDLLVVDTQNLDSQAADPRTADPQTADSKRIASLKADQRQANTVVCDSTA